jgi:hypothetical protein
MKRQALMILTTLSLFVMLTTTLLVETSARTTEKNDLGSSAQETKDKNFPGTWNVTLRFPVCSAGCPCPGGVPNIPIPTLNSYLEDGTLLVALGGSLFAGPGYGSWERIGHNQFKFFLFNSSGMLRGSEEVTKDILLTGPDAFEATSTFDVFDAAGNMTSQGCIINETATRF